jgi:hypothetical protein
LDDDQSGHVPTSLAAKLARRGPFADLVGSLFVVVEVELDPKSAALIGVRKDLKYLEPESASRVLVDELSDFRKSLRLNKDEGCILGMIGVHVKGHSNDKTDKRPVIDQFCILKGDLLSHLMMRKRLSAGKDRAPSEDKDSKGVSIVWIEDEGAEQPQVVAEIQFVFFVRTSDRTELRTKLVTLIHKAEWRWQLGSGPKRKEEKNK